MTAMQIIQIVFVVVLFLNLIVKVLENRELVSDLEMLNYTYKRLLDFKRMEIAELKRMLEAYEGMDWEPYKETEAQTHD